MKRNALRLLRLNSIQFLNIFFLARVTDVHVIEYAHGLMGYLAKLDCFPSIIPLQKLFINMKWWTNSVIPLFKNNPHTVLYKLYIL